MTTRLLIGDVFERMAELSDASFDLIVTSPPFLALRSYLPDGHPDKAKEIGSEATPADYLDTLLALTAEWRRLLAPHGSIAIELGDTYAGSGGGGGDYYEGGFREGQPGFTGSASASRDALRDANARHWREKNAAGTGWPLDKSLTGIPTLYAWSLAYGRNLLTGQPSPAGQWRIRNLKSWVRSNPPVGALGDKERPATSYITVACTGRDRWFDLDAVRTAYNGPPPIGGSANSRQSSGDPRGRGGHRQAIAPESNPGGAPPLDWWHPIDALIDDELNQRAGKNGERVSFGKTPWQNSQRPTGMDKGYDSTRSGANGTHIRRRLEAAGYLTPQDFHDISPRGYAGAHYAVWPPELVRQLVDEMCPRRVCVECGVPSRRIIESTRIAADGSVLSGDFNPKQIADSLVHSAGPGSHNMATHRQMLGWSDCRCPPHGGLVFDTCKNCGEPIRWSLDFRRWLHEQPRVRYCPRNFTPDGKPTTEAEPSSPSADHWRPGRILDPFVGSGTTLAVASGMGRDSVGIDLDERNADLCAERVGMFLEVDYPDWEVST